MYLFVCRGNHLGIVYLDPVLENLYISLYRIILCDVMLRALAGVRGALGEPFSMGPR